MKQKKDICLWVVDGNSKVKKFRLTYLKLSLMAGGFCLLGALLFLIAGDYTRVQILRVKNYLLLKQIADERNSLELTNNKLSSEISDLRELNNRVLNYEQSIKAKLFEISKVIESATTLEVLDEIDSDTASPLEGGVGGAEVDCAFPSHGSCGISSWSDVGLRGRLDPNLIASPQQLAMLPALQKKSSSFVHENLPDKIDRYINLIKKLPLGNPAAGIISSGFGHRVSPFTRRLSLHEGIDISLGKGTEVYSAGEGIVKTVEKHPTYGLMIDIEHNDRIFTRYAHLSKVLVKKGRHVKIGDIVGESGSTGRSTGPHLHYEVRIDGKATNPKNFIGLSENLKKTL